MRTNKILLILLALAAGVFFAGCTTGSHTTADGRNHTVVLGGLFETHEGAYESEPADTLPLNGHKPNPGSRLTGNKISFLWGLVSFRDQ